MSGRFSQIRIDFSRRAAEFIEPRSYCIWELENAERPSVLRGVHGDEPSLCLQYISTYFISLHSLYLHILYISTYSISPHTLYLHILYISTYSLHKPKVSLFSPPKGRRPLNELILSYVSSLRLNNLCGSACEYNSFCAKRAIASISREKPWKAAAKKHKPG